MENEGMQKPSLSVTLYEADFFGKVWEKQS